MPKYSEKQAKAYFKAITQHNTSVEGAMFDGMTVDEKTAYIRDQGVLLSARALRNSIIGGLEIRPRRKSKDAENVIVIGCVVFGTAVPLMSYCTLLRHLGVDYAFLHKELCCGVPSISKGIKEGAPPDQVEKFFCDSRDFMAQNIAAAKALGAKNMIYMCTWCYYMARRYHHDSGVNHLFYLDVLVEKLRDKPLSVKPKTIAYFPGGQHTRDLWTGQVDWDADWPGYRDLLQKIKGVSIIDVPPSYCCKINRDPIYRKAKTCGVLVTGCLPCYGSLQRNSPPSLKVTSLPDILLEALRNGD